MRTHEPMMARTWRAVSVGVVVAFGMVVGLGVYGFVTYRNAVEMVDRMRRVDAALGQLLVTSIEAESSERAYLLTRNPASAASCVQAAETFATGVAQVRALLADDPRQGERLTGIERLGGEGLSRMRDAVASVDAAAPGQRVLDAAGERASMDRFRAAIGEMRAEQERLVRERRADASARGVLITIAVALASVLFGASVAGWWRGRARLERVRRAEAAERQALEERARDALFQERFIAMLGHDLRNPLNAIVVSAEMLARMQSRSDREQRTLLRIGTAAERMARMISQLLDTARSRLGGGLIVTRNDADLAKIARDVIDELAARKGSPIALRVEGDTGGRWDADRIAQVLSNLVGNAVAHGAPECPVEVAVDGCDADRVQIAVSNEGDPIPDDIRDVLFEPFRMASHSRLKTKSEGLGLGLYIARELITLHGGVIDVVSTKEQGTKFTISMPRR
jgi:signal transduction histidine kinase